MSSCAQCEATVPSPVCWPLFHQGWIICSLATSWHGVHEPVGTGSAQSQRDMGTKELHGWTSGHPLELAPSTMSSVLPGQGMCSGDGACCCQSFLPDGGSFGGRAGCISLFLSWNGSIYSLLTLLQ